MNSWQFSEQLKQFLRDNLEIVVEYENGYSRGQNQTIGLKFKGDDKCFTGETIYIRDSYDE